MFKVLSEIPLAAGGKNRFRGMAYDGCRLYLTQTCERSVVAVDCHGEREECFETCRRYSCLCFDPRECRFWASSDECPGVLFKLDRCFREIDCLKLRACGVGVITSVSVQCCADALLVAFADRLALVDCEGNPIWERREHHWLKGALALCPWYFTWCPDEGETLVRLWDREHCAVWEYRIPCGCCIEAAVYDPCGEDCGCPAFWVLVTKRGRYPYLLRCILKDCAVCRGICSCNDRLCCCQHGDECDECKDSCADVLGSIALMEAALSHILNAEGEKLQKVVATCDDPCVLLEVNKSVNAALINATHLEQVLYHKLEALKEVCGDCVPSCGCKTAEYTDRP